MNALGIGCIRPSIPPILICALALWATAAVSIQALGMTARSWYSAYFAGSAALVIAAVLAGRFSRRKLIAVALVGMCLGMLTSTLHAYSLADAKYPETASGVLILREDATSGLYGSSAEAEFIMDGGASLPVKAYFNQQDNLYQFGQRLEADVTLKAPKEQDRQRYWTDGIVANAYVTCASEVQQSGFRAVMVSLRNVVISAIDKSSLDANAKAVLQALVCGYRVDLRSLPINEDFKTVGLAHVVAVSGAHLSLVTALLGGLLTRARLPRWLVIMLQGGFVGAFLLFAAAPISAIRAAIMAWAGLLAYVPRRRPSSLNAIGICVMAILALFPSSACSVSFALSVGSTLGIVLFSSLVVSWLEALPFRLPSIVADSLAITLAANVATLPYSACLFSQLPLIAPLSNIIAAPLFSFACGVGLLCAIVAVALPFAAGSALMVAGAGSSALNFAVQALSCVPYACLPFSGNPLVGLVVSAVLMVALWRLWPAFRLHVMAWASMVVVAIGLLLLVVPALSGPRLVMLDVGQGDAILVQDGYHAVLVDTGTNDAMLRSALARQWIVRLDAVIITHGDDDHDGSLPALSQVVQVGKVIIARDALACPCSNCLSLRSMAEDAVGANNIVGISQGDSIACGSFALNVIWPHSFQDEGGNADSLCLAVEIDTNGDGRVESKALLVGDAEDAQLDQMISSNLVNNVDIYKVGHHGSRSAIDALTAQQLSPAISLVSVGEGNRYGHPVQSTLDSLESAGSRVFRTDLQGDITCRFKDGAIEVRTQK